MSRSEPSWRKLILPTATLILVIGLIVGIVSAESVPTRVRRVTSIALPSRHAFDAINAGSAGIELTGSHFPSAKSNRGCRRGSPLANVYHAYRLTVRNRCLTVSGTVTFVTREDDGDVHVDLRLPPSEQKLLDRANLLHEDGDLVTEIVPADQPGCSPGKPPLPSHGTYNFGICTGADVKTPAIGAHVIETGPYVLDNVHGWTEIHPVWAITVTRAPIVGSPRGVPARCSINAVYNAEYHDYDVYVHSNQPDQTVVVSASDGASASWSTNSNGYADVYLEVRGTTVGVELTARVGAATCSAPL